MFEAYSVAVRIRMIDGLTTGLLGFSRLFGRVHGQAAAFHQQLGRIGVTAATGLGFTILGGAMLRAFHEPMEVAARYEQQLVRLRALGNGPRISGQAQHFAENMRVFGVSRPENLQIMTDAMMVTRGNLHEAEMMAPRIARVQAVLAGMYGEGGRETERQLMNLMRSAEFRGGLRSPEVMNQELDVAMRFITMSGNRITPTDLMQFMKFGGVAATQLSPEAVLALEPLLQETGGMRLGTSMQTLYNRLQTGIGMSGMAGTELMRYGILDRNQVTLTPEGRFRRFNPGAHPLIQADLQRTDFSRWLTDVAFPTMRAHGASDSDMARLGILMGGRTGGQIINSYLRAPELAATARAAGLRSLGIDDAYSLLPSSTIAQAVELHARNEDLKLELGLAALPIMNQALRAMIPLVRSVADFLHANPVATQWLVRLFLALGALVVVAGSIMLISAAFSALSIAFQLIAPALGGIFLLARFINPWVLGLSLLAGAFALVYANWAPFRRVMDGVFHFLGQLFGIADASANPAYRWSTPEERAERLRNYRPLTDAQRAQGWANIAGMAGNAGIGIGGLWLLGVVGKALTNAGRIISFVFLRMLVPAITGLAAIVGWPAVLIIGLVLALTALGVWLYNNVEPFKNAIDGIIGWLGRLFNFLGQHSNTQSDGALNGGVRSSSLLLQRGWLDADGRVTAAGRAAWAASNDNNSRFVRGRAGGVTVQSNLHLDGHRVAQVVTHHQDRAATAPATGASRVNGRIQPMPVAAGRNR